MDTAATPLPNALRLQLHFELTLTRDGPAPRWRADLEGAGPEGPLCFGSMSELIRYLTRLDLQAPPPSGIR